MVIKSEKKGLITEKIKGYQHKEIIVFILIIFIIYLSTLSCSLDDEDSILFIRGVREFNVAGYQPHPPGYPVYIFLGKISVFLIGEELLGLTILSAIFGALSLAVFYFLIFEMYGKKTALISSMIMAVTPLFWLNSLKAMSDIPGLFFILLSMYFIYEFIKYKEIKSLYIGSFVSAIAIGVRFHALFVVIPLLIYACFNIKGKVNGKVKRIKIKSKNETNSKNEKRKLSKTQKKILWCLIFFIFGILVWLIPTLVTNGFFGYFGTVLKHFLQLSKNPGISVLSGEWSFSSSYIRIQDFFKFFLGSGYGVNFWGFDMLPVISLLAYLFFLFLSFWKLKDKKIIFFVLGLSLYVLYTFLSLPIHNPRYLLPIIPFISLLFAFGILWFGKYEHLAFLFLFILLLIHAAPLAKEIHTTEAAPVQLVNYIKANYDLNEVIIFKDSMTGRHLSYYNISSYSSAQLERYLSNKSISDENVNRNGSISEVFDSNKQILIINPYPSIIKEYNLTLIKRFDRDIRVHEKHNSVRLYELKKFP